MIYIFSYGSAFGSVYGSAYGYGYYTVGVKLHLVF